MKILIRDVGAGVNILDCLGKLTLDNGERRCVRPSSSFRNGRTKSILNLGEVSHVDGAALGELVSCWKRACAIGAQIRLLNLSGRLSQVMEITKLLSLFGGSYSEEREAISSFREPPETDWA
jgi:anti-sigma B factor antagonist